MLIKLYPENPEEKKLKQITECLLDGGIIIYPTGAVYSMGCLLSKTRSMDTVASFKGVKAEKANFSIICSDISHIADYARPLPTNVFKAIKKNLPGNFTFIVEGNNSLPKLFKGKRKTIGIRIPSNPIPRILVERCNNTPLIATSIHDEDEIMEYTTDPELIYEKYQNQVDIVIDGGLGNLDPTTVVDCTSGELEIIRQSIDILDY